MLDLPIPIFIGAGVIIGLFAILGLANAWIWVCAKCDKLAEKNRQRKMHEPDEHEPEETLPGAQEGSRRYYKQVCKEN